MKKARYSIGVARRKLISQSSTYNRQQMTANPHKTTRPEDYFTSLEKPNGCSAKSAIKITTGQSDPGDRGGLDIVYSMICFHGWWVPACVDEDPEQPIHLDPELYWQDPDNGCLKSNLIVLLNELKNQYRMPYNGDCVPSSPEEIADIINAVNPLWRAEMYLKVSGQMFEDGLPAVPPSDINFNLNDEEISEANEYLANLLNDLPDTNSAANPAMDTFAFIDN